MMKRLLDLGVVIVAVHVIFLLLAGCSGDPAQDPLAGGEERALTATTVVVDKQNAYVRTTDYVGRVEAARSSELGFELAGTLLDVRVDEGSPVTKGDVLAELDTARLEARRAELEAALEEAKAAVELAEATFERTKSLVARKAVSEQALDEARQGQDSTRAAVRRIGAQLDTVDVDLSKSTLMAPFDGKISERLLNEGTIVTPGQAVLQILETGKLEIRAGVSSGVAEKLKPGQELNVHTETGHSVQVAVDRILPQRGRVTRTVDVLLVRLGDDARLRDGDLVVVPIQSEVNAEGYWLPRMALTGSARGLWSCYVTLPPGEGESGPARKVERRELEILHQEGDRVFVTGGLRDGDHVVTSGVHRLVQGQRVLEAGGALTRSVPAEPANAIGE